MNRNPLVGFPIKRRVEAEEGELFVLKYIFDFVQPKTALWRSVCCDCGLTHDFEFVVKENAIEVKAWRNERATARRRRKRPARKSRHA